MGVIAWCPPSALWQAGHMTPADARSATGRLWTGGRRHATLARPLAQKCLGRREQSCLLRRSPGPMRCRRRWPPFRSDPPLRRTGRTRPALNTRAAERTRLRESAPPRLISAQWRCFSQHGQARSGRSRCLRQQAPPIRWSVKRIKRLSGCCGCRNPAAAAVAGASGVDRARHDEKAEGLTLARTGSAEASALDGAAAPSSCAGSLELARPAARGLRAGVL